MAELFTGTPPPGKSKSRYAKIFEQIKDGNWWKIPPSDHEGVSLNNFRLSLQGWFKHRGMYAETKSDSEGNLYVRVTERNHNGT